MGRCGGVRGLLFGVWGLGAIAACSGESEVAPPEASDGGTTSASSSSSSSSSSSGGPLPVDPNGPSDASTDADASAKETGPKTPPMPTCDPPSATPSFFTTFEDLSATQTPAVGVGQPTLTGGTFVPGKCGGALYLLGKESVTIPASVNGTFNIKKAKGSLSFWVKPGSAADAGDAGTGGALFESGFDGTRFLGSYGGNRFYFLVYLDVGKYVSAKTYENAAWFTGDWVHVKYTWDFETGGYMSIAVNGKSEGSSSVVLGGAVGGLGEITFGSKGASGKVNASFDELRFFP